MDKLKYIKLENEDGSYSDSIPLAVDSDHVDVNGDTLTNELNKKVNIDIVNKDIEDLQSEINSLAKGSPKGSYETVSALVNSNPSSGVYIVVENGHIYSWTKNGSSAIDLGVYLPTEIGDKTVSTEKTNFAISKNIIPLNKDLTSTLYYNSSTHKFSNGTDCLGIILKCDPNKFYWIEKNLSSRFTVLLSEEYPVSGVSYESSYVKQNSTQMVVKTSSNIHYIAIFYGSHANEEESIINSLKVYDTDTLNDNSITNKILIDDLKINNIDVECFPFVKRTNKFNKNDFLFTRMMKNVESDYFTYAKCNSFIFKVKQNTRYIVEKIPSSRFHVYTCADFPSEHTVIIHDYDTIQHLENFDYIDFTTNESEQYFVCYYGTNSDNVDDIIDSMMVLEEHSPVDEYISYDNISIDPNEIDIGEEEIKVTKLDDNMFKLLSYKPVGQISKGYICLTCDDGANSLAEYTIPRIQYYNNLYNKNIPVTFALMSSSSVFNNNTYKALVADMVQNHECEVAIHGHNSYLSYSLDDLDIFLKTQKQLLTDLCGAEPKSIIYPNHDYNEKTSVVAGSMFGICCTGGVNTPIKYKYSTVGPRSNMYTLYRDSLLNVNMTVEKLKTVLDYAKENNLIYIPFWHDNSLNTEAKKLLLDTCIEYGNEIGLDFITVSDIKTVL